jgi:hypothetical protein
VRFMQNKVQYSALHLAVLGRHPACISLLLAAKVTTGYGFVVCVRAGVFCLFVCLSVRLSFSVCVCVCVWVCVCACVCVSVCLSSVCRSLCPSVSVNLSKFYLSRLFAVCCHFSYQYISAIRMSPMARATLLFTWLWSLMIRWSDRRTG